MGGQAQLLGISHGSVYCLPKPALPVNLDAMCRLDELRLGCPFVALVNCVIS
ncbi:hypothetical protein MKFW12EY_14240 [Methylomonas koyamae]|nr:hypothetical protein MKFW12EY_14240 [Methylomonas koyamae]